MIKLFADWLTYTIFNLAPKTLLYDAVNFFVYDTIKIFILLILIIFSVSLIRSFFPTEKIRAILSRRNKYVGNLLASMLGMITPFCTCSAIPLFLGFLEAGIPLGTTFSFLVASPMINEVAIVLLLGIFGWKIAGLYILSGLIISVFSGIIIGKMKLEKLIKNLDEGSQNRQRMMFFNWRQRLLYAKSYTVMILRKVWIYILVGIGIGAFIHGYVPTDFLSEYASSGKWYAVPLAVLAGIPLYSNAAGIIPLVGALTEKGVAIGTSLAFMMAVTGLSLPEFMILKRIMKVKLIIIFASIAGIGILLTGFLFNFILNGR